MLLLSRVCIQVSQILELPNCRVVHYLPLLPKSYGANGVFVGWTMVLIMYNNYYILIRGFGLLEVE